MKSTMICFGILLVKVLLFTSGWFRAFETKNSLHQSVTNLVINSASMLWLLLPPTSTNHPIRIQHEMREYADWCHIVITPRHILYSSCRYHTGMYQKQCQLYNHSLLFVVLSKLKSDADGWCQLMFHCIFFLHSWWLMTTHLLHNLTSLKTEIIVWHKLKRFYYTVSHSVTRHEEAFTCRSSCCWSINIKYLLSQSTLQAPIL